MSRSINTSMDANVWKDERKGHNETGNRAMRPREELIMDTERIPESLMEWANGAHKSN